MRSNEGPPCFLLVSPEMGHRARITYQRRSCYPSEFIGAWPVVLEMNRHTLQYGRFFNELDERGGKTGLRYRRPHPQPTVRRSGINRSRDQSGGEDHPYQPAAVHRDRNVHRVYDRCRAKSEGNSRDRNAHRSDRTQATCRIPFPARRVSSQKQCGLYPDQHHVDEIQSLQWNR